MKRKSYPIIIFSMIWLSGCTLFQSARKNLPPLNKPSYLSVVPVFSEKGISFEITNDLPIERTFLFKSDHPEWQEKLHILNPVQLPARSKTTTAALPLLKGVDISFLLDQTRGISFWGNPNTVRPDTSYRYQYPFPRGKTYRILQGYNGSFSHNQAHNQYAIDFGLPVGDTIQSARAGIVAYLFEDSSIGGKKTFYLEYANSILIMHDDGTVAQYSHLKKDGALIEIGDKVEAGQAIGISGETGFADGAHLHFNLMKADTNGMVSLPLKFEKNDGAKLRIGLKVTH